MRGHVDHLSHQVVSGWAFDPAQPERAVIVKISVNGVGIARIPANIYREDLKNLAANATGKYAFEYNFPPPLSVFSEQEVVVSFVDDGSILSKGQKKLLPVGRMTSHVGKPLPLLVTAMGRSGTTLLMKKLSLHHEIVVAGPYPFEIKLLSYYALAFRTLVSEGDRQRSSHPDQMGLPSNRFAIGFNPYNHPNHENVVPERGVIADFFTGDVPTSIAKSFRDIISRYYDLVRIGQNKVATRYIAEKIILGDTTRMAPRFFFGGAKEVVLIRDPRDLVCSFESFWKFGGEEAIRSIAHSLEEIKAIQQEERSDTIVVKFEDLISEPDKCLGRIFSFLDIEPSLSKEAEDEAAIFRLHGTSASPEAAIGRWRRDLNPAQIEKCSAVFGPFLDFFGYN